MPWAAGIAIVTIDHAELYKNRLLAPESAAPLLAEYVPNADASPVSRGGDVDGISLFLQAFVISRIQNLVWSHTTLERHGFVPRLETGELFRVLWVNLFATVITIGLYRPFAQVRLAQYLTSAMLVRINGPIDDIAAADRLGPTTAVGEEAAEFFDFDIAF